MTDSCQQIHPTVLFIRRRVPQFIHVCWGNCLSGLVANSTRVELPEIQKIQSVELSR